jgi:hypothetical protein
MLIEQTDPVYCTIKPKQDMALVKKCLEYSTERWKQGPYKSIKISKSAYFCDQRNGTFLAGLLPVVVDFCKLNGIETKVIPYDSTIGMKPIKFKLTLDADQEPLLQNVDSHRRGIILAPPGIGKTVMAGAIICQYGMPVSAMVVHTECQGVPQMVWS